MSNPPATLHTWLAAPLPPAVARAIDRLRQLPGARRIAVMPDVHLATDVAIGVVFATTGRLYPQAVGGDIGCGVLAVALTPPATADPLPSPAAAGRILAALGRAIPPRRRNRSAALPLPAELAAADLSHPRLTALARSEAALEFATLGSGNHFLELQRDEADGRLWLAVHSGSRALGPAIRDHHLATADPPDAPLRSLDAASPAGEAYLHDAALARRYAAASRRAMAELAGEILTAETGARLDWATAIETDHNHVERETHAGEELWVHRKGAMRAPEGALGVLPGSMGAPTFHVEGRGHPEAMQSSAHGAGRELSRTEARRRISERDLHRQMERAGPESGPIWYDARLATALRDEAPAAYKDIRAVLRAQRDLVRLTRTLHPLLNYKGI